MKSEVKQMQLSELVKRRLADLPSQQTPDEVNEALRRASELSDLFGDVTPNESTIPLDALAGFPVVIRDEQG